MIEEMASLLENFPGAANQTRCFLHVLNLTVKSILRQFEMPKKKTSKDDGDDDREEIVRKAASELLALSTEIEEDYSRVDDSDDKNEDVEDDNEEGLEDERQHFSAEQIAELDADLIPVRLMLTKV